MTEPEFNEVPALYVGSLEHLHGEGTLSGPVEHGWGPPRYVFKSTEHDEILTSPNLSSFVINGE